MLSERGSVDWIQNFTQQRNNIWWFMQRRVVTRECQRRTFLLLAYIIILLNFPRPKAKRSAVRANWSFHWSITCSGDTNYRDFWTESQILTLCSVLHVLALILRFDMDWKFSQPPGFTTSMGSAYMPMKLDWKVQWPSSSPSENSPPRLCNLEFRLNCLPHFSSCAQRKLMSHPPSAP